MPDNRGSWQFDRHINVGHIFLTVGLLVSAITAWTALDKRVTVLEQQYGQQAKVQEEIKSELIRLNGKMDRLLESVFKR